MAEKICNWFHLRGRRMAKQNLSPLKKIEPEGIESDEISFNIVYYNSNQLKIITNEFDENNFVTPGQFGKVFRGEIPNGWDGNGTRRVSNSEDMGSSAMGISMPGKTRRICGQQKGKINVRFLQHPSVSGHSNLVRLIGYCCDEEEGIYAVVYDLNPLDTLHNLITTDSFYWRDRIKVALELAHLLAFLHGHKLPYMVRNLDAMHIMIDEDLRPILFDFGMLAGGIMGEPNNLPEKPNIKPLMGSIGYIDIAVAIGGGWSLPSDVYSFGKLLLSIISKRVVDKAHPQNTVIREWEVKAAYEKKKACCKKEAECSIVNEHLMLDPTYDARDGHAVILLALRCAEYNPEDRPKMKDVFKCLQRLHVVRGLREVSGVKI